MRTERSLVKRAKASDIYTHMQRIPMTLIEAVVDCMGGFQPYLYGEEHLLIWRSDIRRLEAPDVLVTVSVVYSTKLNPLTRDL